MKITQEEFKTLFGLDNSCRVPSDTLRIYNKQIEGVYLLYREILNISDKKFKNVDGTKLIANYEPYKSGFQTFITTYGSRNKFRVSYIDKHGSKTPFWTYTKYPVNVVAKFRDSAYKSFISTVLTKLRYKYSKYHINFNFRDYSISMTRPYPQPHPNDAIWWDEVVFNSLFYYDSNGNPQELKNQKIQETICNRSGIWYRDIPDPIRRVMNKIDDKLEKRNNKY